MTARATQPQVMVGVMSGTSLDGISAAVVSFADRPTGRPQASLLHFVQRDYTVQERERLAAAMQGGTARDMCRLHADLGEWLGDAACDAMRGAGVAAADVRAVASHGQTLWHEAGHSTWQIGDAARIAERTGCAVIADFRARDMAVGGQGAPLVPMADVLLFAHEVSWRALQNIGGIGNVTIVPPATTGADPRVRAFDTGPGVVIMNGVMQRLFGAPFDRDGAMAATGRVDEQVVHALLAHPYFVEAPPKSTGRELFTPAFIEAFVTRCTDAGASPADVVATATAFTAATIADQYLRFLPEAPHDVLLSGGGARNATLVRLITDALARQSQQGRAVPQVRLFEDLFFDAEAKEAVAFALLGYLHLAGRPGNVPSATGAQAPRVLGALTPAASSEPT